MEDLTREEIHELLRCALNRMGVIIPSTTARQDAAALLVAKKLMEAKPGDVLNLSGYPVIKPMMRRDARVWLTDAGKQIVMDLKPDEFLVNTWWPLPADVKEAQRRIRKSEV